MTSTHLRRTFSATTIFLVGLAGCDSGLPLDWHSALDLAKKESAGSGTAPTTQDKPDPTGKTGTTAPPAPEKCPPPSADKPAPAPGGTAVECEATSDPATGLQCKICKDASGAVVYKDCAGAPQPSPPAGTSASCTAVTDEKTGQVCKECVDESGKILFTDCGAGTAPPPPSDPNPIKCADLASEDPAYQFCTVCWDATGVEIKRACVPVSDGTTAPVPPEKKL